MRIISTGDIQISSKSIDIVTRYLDKVYNLVEDNDENDDVTILIPGDVFEYGTISNDHVPPSAILQPFIEFFDKISLLNEDYRLKGLPSSVSTVIVAGNHDKTYGVYPDAVHSLSRGSSGVFVWSDSVTNIDCSSVNFILVPWPNYLDTSEELIEQINNRVIDDKINYLVGHIRNPDAIYKTKTKLSCGVPMLNTKEFEKLRVEIGSIGDIHTHQCITGNIYYIGAAYQRHFGEAGNLSLIRETVVDGNKIISDEFYDVTEFEHIIIDIESPEDLNEILSSYEFTDHDKYRLNINYEVDELIRVPQGNISVKYLNRKKEERYEPMKILSIDEMLMQYNKACGTFNDEEFNELMEYYKNVT